MSGRHAAPTRQVRGPRHAAARVKHYTGRKLAVAAAVTTGSFAAITMPAGAASAHVTTTSTGTMPKLTAHELHMLRCERHPYLPSCQGVSLPAPATSQTPAVTVAKATTAIAGTSTFSQVASLAQSLAGGGHYYAWGGTGPNGFDCSGLVQYVYAQSGISVDRTSEAQAAEFHPTSTPLPGDLVSYWSRGDAYHSAIYLGNGMVVSALNESLGIQVTPVNFPGSSYTYGTLR